MRSVVCACLLFAAGTLPSRGGDDALTAEELAHHLGVTAWVSKMHLQGETLLLQVFRVVDGKVSEKPLVGSAAFPTDREFTRVAILASHMQGGTHLSIKPAAGPAASNQVASIPLTASIPLPEVLTPGDYVLGGDVPIDGVTQKNPAKAQDVKDGLLLRVSKRP